MRHNPGLSRPANKDARQPQFTKLHDALVRDTLAGYAERGGFRNPGWSSFRKSLQAIAARNLGGHRRTAEMYMLSGNLLNDLFARAFLSLRDRRAIIDYLCLQESADAVVGGAASWDLRETLRRLSRLASGRTLLRLQLPVIPGYHRCFEVPFDPFRHYRAIYGIVLASKRKGRPLRLPQTLAIWLHRRFAAAKACAVQGGLRLYLRLCGQWPALRQSTFERNLQQLIALACTRLFNVQGQVVQVDEVVRELVPYFSTRLGALFREVEPAKGSTLKGWSKLAKIVTGILVWRAARRTVAQDATQYVIASFKIAYCWGVTYPLVDDVIDASNASMSVRRDICSVVEDAFRRGTVSTEDAADGVVGELQGRMVELRALLEQEESLLAAREAILATTIAHHEDAIQRLNSVALCNREERMLNAISKAASVRVASLLICGVPICNAALQDIYRMALFNQLGDDIWDIEEDLVEGRATPVTVQLLSGAENPFCLYLDYAAYLSSRADPTLQQLPIALAVADTYRLSYAIGSPSTRRLLRESLVDRCRQLNPAALLCYAQRVDPDSFIFELEVALSPLVELTLRSISDKHSTG